MEQQTGEYKAARIDAEIGDCLGTDLYYDSLEILAIDLGLENILYEED